MSKFIILTLVALLVLEATGVSGCCWAPGVCGYCGGYRRSNRYKQDRKYWEQKEFLFAVSRSGQPYVYRDDNGALAGFTLDVIDAVCAIAEKTCRVTDLPSDVCSKSVENQFAPGDYLMGGEVDGCAMWTSTPDRENSVDFTAPIYEASNQYFITLSQNLFSAQYSRNFVPNNLNNDAIVVLNGWVTNAFCLSSNGASARSVTTVDTVNEAIAALKDRSAQAFFYTRNVAIGDNALTAVQVPDNLKCGTSQAIMVKEGSHIPTWWDSAFDEFVTAGDFAALCSQASTTHTVDPHCVGL